MQHAINRPLTPTKEIKNNKNKNNIYQLQNFSEEVLEDLYDN